MSYPDPNNPGQMISGTGPTVTMYDYWNANVASVQDYYPFGMEMPGRTYSSGVGLLERFGFNGKMKDDEVAAKANWQDYGFRMYEVRLARFSSLDPLTKKYPELTPYQFASNSPTSGVDLDGLEYLFAANGRFLGQGPDKQSTQVRVAMESDFRPRADGRRGYEIDKSTMLSLNIKEFLDRAHMIYGEGGGNGINADGTNPAQYFAWAFENYKNFSRKTRITEEAAKIGAWKDASSSYEKGTIQTAGDNNSQYSEFNRAREQIVGNSNSDALNNLPGANNVVSAVIGVLLKTTTDPTMGAYQWVGGKGTGDNNDTWQGRMLNSIPTAKINTSSKWYKSFTVFYKFKKH